MAESSTLLSLPQLVDISLNCHEGVINFHTLHSLLHIIIQQLAINDVAVEFRGTDSDRLQSQIIGMKTSDQPFLEYSIKGQKKKKSKKTVSLQDIKEQQKAEEKKEKELRVIERRKNSKEEPALEPIPLKSPPGSSIGLRGDVSTVVLVESDSKLPQFSVAVSKSAFDDLQDELEILKKKVKELTELPGNMGLIEATRTGSSPILDMFQILTLTKRMDAAEIAMDKLGLLLEDIVKQNATPEMLDKVKEIKESVERTSIKPTDDIAERLNRIENTIQILTKNKESEIIPSDTVSRQSDKTQPSIIQQPSSSQKPFESCIQGINLSELPIDQALALIQQELLNIENSLASKTQSITDRSSVVPGKLDELEIQLFTESRQKVEEMDKVYTQQIGLLNEQLTALQKEMNDIMTKLDIILPGGDSTGINAETTMELANKLVLLEKEIITISENAEKLQAEKEERDKNMEAILEQIDVLKIVKANREDLDDALGDKADACQINRKVSHDQFDAACDDLSRGIEEALNKLQEQEDMWHQALDSIQKDVGNKLDRMEVDPLRDFVNNKLKALQEKFKSLTALKKEQEAAGTKSKLLRDVNCISCDKDVVMRKEMDQTMKPRPYAMPPNRSMAPYLAYELDQLRKQQKCVPGSKNLNFFESAVKTRAIKDKNHVCNRYCGGSHTVTTPQQRVTRLGHFLEQWGPEIAPLNDEYVRGVDNHMYKAREDSGPKKSIKPLETVSLSVKGSIKSNKEEAVSKDLGAAQSERKTYISGSAEALLNKEAEKLKSGAEAKKVHNIGSTSADHTMEEERPSQDVRHSQTEPRSIRLSQEQAIGPRASQEGYRGSQSQSEERRVSKTQSVPSKTSQNGEGPNEVQTTQVQDRPSKTSQKEEGSIEVRSSKIERKESFERKTSAMKTTDSRSSKQSEAKRIGFQQDS